MKKKNVENRSLFTAIALGLFMVLCSMGNVFAAEKATETTQSITAVGRYSNWDGVTNVAQFLDAGGNLCFAVDSDSVVTVYRTNASGEVVQTLPLVKQHSKFGTAICDANGYYYLVTGEDNTTDDTNVETVFIS